MEIHKIVKINFDKCENFKELPKSVRLAYFEIENYETKKKEAKIKKIEQEKKEIMYTWIDKKNEIKKQFMELGGSTRNYIGFFAYSQILNKWNTNPIKSIDLYKNLNDENIFYYLLQHTKEFLCKNSTKEHNLLNLFKLYITEDNNEIFNYIFKQNEIILNENFRQKSRSGEYIIKINNEYYILHNDERMIVFDKYNLVVKKLIPKEYNNFIFYHYDVFDKELIKLNITNEQYEKQENKKIHIKIFDKLYFIDKL